MLCYITSNLNACIEILEKQNSLFPSGPVIKCLLLELRLDGVNQQKTDCKTNFAHFILKWSFYQI